ncbi:uncharacterized protein F4812DRAFT_170353 [Daldinia caldariorum]|uniref:uncharacterized protein n=1 Tax=Daldinia caldariorum TaxID=326644 RepID=UPI002008E60C|nr:uncharacterized protein F4812DRAFT_170353 [Daldinia caldariorum]KAI1471210.1 hypothetical protein F4812DRAFT_170353 [Daldinia caldariorum]
MAPLTPHWDQPSHPDIQEVIINPHEFSSKSLSKISLPPFGLYAKLEFPPCTLAASPSYATVQCGRDAHLDLNSDLLYINHSCEPSLIFDTANMNVRAGPNGLSPGEELTFFYPSTEWSMAQPFDCLCGAPSCRGRIAGAKDMSEAQLAGLWLNGHILELLEEREREREGNDLRDMGTRNKEPAPENGTSSSSTLTAGGGLTEIPPPEDLTAQALRNALAHAEKVVEAASAALQSYLASAAEAAALSTSTDGRGERGPAGAGTVAALASGLTRRGITSRELSGEMGGDTIAVSGS